MTGLPRLGVLSSPLLLCLAMTAGAQEYLDAAALFGAPGMRFQEQFGAISVAPDPVGARSEVVMAVAGGKRGGQVGKAALILPFAPHGPGASVSVEADIYLPPGSPRDSMHLMDLECKYCGVPGNPGLRLYLRDGRLRIDRKKIDGGHAWANATAPRVPIGRWARLRWELTLGTEARPGRAVVWLDGVEVLRAAGRTLPPVAEDRAAVDRLQIGVTANSNAEDVAVWLGRVSLELTP